MTQQELTATNLAQLQAAVSGFTAFFEQESDFQEMVYALWNAKDILGHITFWHESFARNIADLGNGHKPQPLKGKLSEVNKQSVETTRAVSKQELISRLLHAQAAIEAHIFDEHIDMIPYKKGSRDYSRLEHLEVVTHHINKHLRDLEKAFKKSKKQ